MCLTDTRGDKRVTDSIRFHQLLMLAIEALSMAYRFASVGNLRSVGAADPLVPSHLLDYFVVAISFLHRHCSPSSGAFSMKNHMTEGHWCKRDAGREDRVARIYNAIGVTAVLWIVVHSEGGEAVGIVGRGLWREITKQLFSIVYAIRARQG